MVGYLLCGSCIQPKNSLKFKLLAFRRKKTPFIDQKCTHENVTKNLGRALPIESPHAKNCIVWTITTGEGCQKKRLGLFFIITSNPKLRDDVERVSLK